MPVRRKAARVLGVLHADVDDTDIKNICAMFKSHGQHASHGRAESLRGLKAQSTIPEIRPCSRTATRM